MANKLAAKDYSVKELDDKNLKIPCLIWLDNDLNDPEIEEAEQRLGFMMNRMRKFTDVSLCKTFIESRLNNSLVVMVVSGQLGREIVPSIHMLEQVLSIYVYCMNRAVNKQWASNFSKVKDVVVELDELMFRIKTDYESYVMVKKQLPMTFFTTNLDGSTSTKDLNSDFIFSQAIMDCLLRLKSMTTEKNELIQYCKNQYENDKHELTSIIEFEKNYSSEKVLWWYSQKSFFYKTLQKVLRTENIPMLTLFRPLISDIQHQLIKYQVKQPLLVYRSQIISNDELTILKAYSGQFISMNTFFSAHIDKKQALSFIHLSDIRGNHTAILFEIDADPAIISTKPFADINPHSEYPSFSEILFMPASIFRLKSVTCSDTGQLWTVQLALCSDTEEDLKTVFMYLKRELGHGDTNLYTLGKLLWRRGKFELAEYYLTRLSQELPTHDPFLSDLYEDLAELASQAGNYDMSLQWHEKSLALKSPHQLNKQHNLFDLKHTIVIPNILIDDKWTPNGIIVAGGQGSGDGLNRLQYPSGLDVDKNQTIFIADTRNHRIVEWKIGDTYGRILADSHERKSGLIQLCFPMNVLVDEETDSLIICDQGNRQVVRWSRRKGTIQGEVLLENINCRKLAMDDQRHLYVCDVEKHEVRRYRIGDKKGVLVAGGHGPGDKFHQLNSPTSIVVDQQQTIYVSDTQNHRVMQWNKGATEGIVVAGGQGEGDALTQLSHPKGISIDALHTIYVADSRNNRVVRWPKGETQGMVIAGGNGEGDAANQFNGPMDLTFDQCGNLYVVDMRNHRVQRFAIEHTQNDN